MSAIVQAQRNKNADLRRRSPTGHHDARTNQQAVHQTYPRSLPSAPVIHHQTAKPEVTACQGDVRLTAGSGHRLTSFANAGSRTTRKGITFAAPAVLCAAPQRLHSDCRPSLSGTAEVRSRKIRNGKQSPICITSIALPKSPMSLTCGDEVPHIFTQNPRQ